MRRTRTIRSSSVRQPPAIRSRVRGFPRIVIPATAAIWFLLWTGPETVLFAAPSVSAPAELHVVDTPDDGGGSLTAVWTPSLSDAPDANYQVLVGEAAASDPI